MWIKFFFLGDLQGSETSFMTVEPDSSQKKSPKVGALETLWFVLTLSLLTEEENSHLITYPIQKSNSKTHTN